MIRRVCIGLSFAVLLAGQACKPKPNESNIPAAAADKKPIPDSLPVPTEDEKARIRKSIALLDTLYGELERKPDCKMFTALVGRLRGKDIFHHVEHQAYRILIPSDQAFKRIPAREMGLLTSTEAGLQGYQMTFFIHHVCPEPYNPYPGYGYRSLAGYEYKFGKDSLMVKDLNKKSGITDLGFKGSNLHLFELSEALFY